MAARLGWPRYWLVDPLDGTKEFVSRNGEFTVNIALIEQGTPRWGWSMPRYWTSSGMGQGDWRLAWADGRHETIQTRPRRWASVARGGQSQSPVAGDTRVSGPFWRTGAGEIELVSMGSSLKFCIIAEGRPSFTRGSHRPASGIRGSSGGTGRAGAASPSSMVRRFATTSPISSIPGLWPGHESSSDTKKAGQCPAFFCQPRWAQKTF